MGWVAFVVIGWFIYGLLVNFGIRDDDNDEGEE